MQKTITRILSLQTAIYLTLPVCFLSTLILILFTVVLIGSCFTISQCEWSGLFVLWIIGLPFLVGLFTLAMFMADFASKLFRYGVDNMKHAELLANIVIVMIVVGFVSRLTQF